MPDEARQRIGEFLKKNHVLTVSAVNEGQSWCASCFYVFEEASMRFLLLSEQDTQHARMILHNPNVSGTVAGQPRIISRIQGLQFSGTCHVLDGEESKIARKLYLRRFPIALPSKAPIWALEINKAKLTDNRLGFGSKILWERP